MPTAFAVFPHGVIGNTTVFGTVILGSSPGGEADFCSPLTGVFAGCGLFFHLDPFTLATFSDLRKRLTLRQNSVTIHPANSSGRGNTSYVSVEFISAAIFSAGV